MNRIIGFSSVLATIIITAVIGNVWMFLILNNHVFRILKTPSPGNNTYIYVLNDVAEEALQIAENDDRGKLDFLGHGIAASHLLALMEDG